MPANTVGTNTRLRGLALLIAATSCASPAVARRPGPPSEARMLPIVMLVDFGSGQVLYARNPDRRFLPASMTKVMTALVAFDRIRQGKLSRDQHFTVTPQIAREWSGKGTSMYLLPGERVRVHDLLQGIMTASANDAAIVLAQGHSGSVEDWTELMNGAAARLGMSDSFFATPNGWPDGGRTYVSARDLVRLSSAMIRHYPKDYAAYSGRRSFVWRGRVLYSHDPVSGVVAGADGIKTGYTREAGYNFLGSASREGRRLIMVTGGARSDEQRAQASRALLEWGFAAWRKQPLFAAGEGIAAARVQGGEQASVGLASANPVHAAVPVSGSRRIALRVTYSGPVPAPIARGQRIAVLEIRVDDMPAGRVPLVATRAVGKGGAMDRLANGFMNLWR